MRRPMCLIAMCLCVVIFIMLKIRPPSVLEDDGSFPKEAVLQGTVCDKYFKNGSFCLVLSKARFLTGNIPQKKEYKVIVKLKGKEDTGDHPLNFLMSPEAGQVCRVYGRIYIFEVSRNPGQFDMAHYEKYKGVDLELTSAVIKDVSGRGDPVKEYLLRIKHRLSVVYESLADEDDAGILKAMVLGDKNSITADMKGLYQRAGISHMLCISGLHISVIGCGMYLFLQGRLKPGRPGEKLFLTRLPAGIISMTVLVLYGMMTGMGVSVKRAVIMFVLLTVAEICGRSYDMLSALSFSSLILLFINPCSLYDPGFVLSFAAVLGIGLVKPAADVLYPIKNKGAPGKILESLKLSLCINVFTLPLVLLFFYRIPIYSVFLNLILVPLMGVLLVFAVLTGITGLISLNAARIFSCVCRMILGFYEGVCRINDRLPYSVCVKGCPGIWEIIIYYLILALIIGYICGISSVKHSTPDKAFCSARILRRIKKIRSAIPIRYVRAAVPVILFASFVILPVKNEPGIRITMLDIGQGDCGYISTKTGKTVLIDCGSSDEEEIGKYKVIPFLRYMGKNRIDVAVVTHADNDHISGFKELFEMPEEESVPVKVLLMPDTAMKDEAYMELVRMARKRKVDIKLISAGESFEIDDIRFKCLHPDRGYECEDRNEYSTVLSVSYGRFSALFTGDVQGRGEEIVTERTGDKGYTLLKCAHHGSGNSTPEEFVNRVRPAITFISAGRNNRYGHPQAGVVKRLEGVGSKVLVTKESGALSLMSNGKEVSVSTFIR